MNQVLKKIFFSGFIFFMAGESFSQITSGKIIYERRTNLYKKFKDHRVKDWLKEEEKNKIDYFELFFTDSVSLFKSQESDLKEQLSWATSKNTVYQNFNNKSRSTIKPIWGEEMYLEDSLYLRAWKITDSKRKIAGYSCRKAVWQANDSVRVYAWYCDDIMVSSGPENFTGLPGMILGLATEDGGIVYFATRVEITKHSPGIFVFTKPKRAKVYSSQELKAELEDKYGKEKWGKAMIQNNFGLW